MRVSVGHLTKRILLERGIYGQFVSEMSKVQTSNVRSINIENLEAVLRKYDSSLFNEYNMTYTRNKKGRVDLNLSFRNKKRYNEN